MIELRARLPHPRLRPYIKMYFAARDDAPPRVQRTLPNGDVGLCFYRGSTVLYDGVGRLRSCVSGQLMHYQDIVADGAIDIVGAHFTTVGAHALLQVPMTDISGRTVALADLGDAGWEELERRIMDASDHEECFGWMDACLLQRLDGTKDNMLTMRRLQRAIAYGSLHLADARMAEVAGEACLSQRHFSRLFTQTVGLTPKEYLRLQRFRATLNDMKRCCSGAAGDETLTQIAYRNGYCDYAHLYADCRKISGYAPRELMERSEGSDDTFGWRL